MLRILILSSIVLLSLTACGPAATALPTEKPVATLTFLATATPEPTHTLTPTLEPWMLSLPSDVASVEMVGDDIFGLDTQGNRAMQFDLEDGEWKKLLKPVADVNAHLQEMMQQLMAEKGYSTWQEYLQNEVVNQSEYDASVQLYSYDVYLPFDEGIDVGKVLPHFTAEVESQVLRNAGITEVELMPMAIADADGLVALVAGVYMDGVYVPVLAVDVGPGGSSTTALSSPQDLDKLTGQIRVFRVVNKLSYHANPDDPESFWSTIQEKRTDDPDLYAALFDLRTPQSRQVLELLLTAQDGYILNRLVEEPIRNKPADMPNEFRTDGRKTVALLNYVVTHGYSADPWLVPFTIGVDKGTINNY